MNAPNTLVRSRMMKIGALALEGDLAIPESPTGIVVFAHGSGSSRFRAHFS